MKNILRFLAALLLALPYGWSHSHDIDHAAHPGDEDHHGLRIITEHKERHPALTRCGTISPTEEEKELVSKQMKDWMKMNGEAFLSTQATKSVGTYFHIITNGAAGQVSDSRIQEQLKVLNDRFAPFGFTFVLQGIDRTNNANWYSTFTESNMQQMGQALRKGGKSTLNVYVLIPGNLLGIVGLFPWEGAGSPMDGVWLLNESMPGGAAVPYNLGITLVHEVGHWLGLFHTFEGGCSGSGDEVSDTPAEGEEADGCPIGRDTCPSSPGLDPVTNYMDYSDDNCLVSLNGCTAPCTRVFLINKMFLSRNTPFLL
jgi:hypothetical protein